MFAEKIFENQFICEFAKIFSRKNFPLYGILVSGATQEEHSSTCSCMEKAGLRVQEDIMPIHIISLIQSTFGLIYLGYQIDAEWLHPLDDKVQAVANAPSPKNVHELKAYLGLLTYYSKFLPDLLTKLQGSFVPRMPRGAEGRNRWRRSKHGKNCWSTSSRFLIHFNPKLKFVLVCDASAYGVGAVLAHQLPDGSKTAWLCIPHFNRRREYLLTCS